MPYLAEADYMERIRAGGLPAVDAASQADGIAMRAADRASMGSKRSSRTTRLLAGLRLYSYTVFAVYAIILKELERYSPEQVMA